MIAFITRTRLLDAAELARLSRRTALRFFLRGPIEARSCCIVGHTPETPRNPLIFAPRWQTGQFTGIHSFSGRSLDREPLPLTVEPDTQKIQKKLPLPILASSDEFA